MLLLFKVVEFFIEVKNLGRNCIRGNIWREGKFIEGEIHIEEGRIKLIAKTEVSGKKYIIPSFSDPHIHGGWGYSFQNGDFLELEKKLRELGVLFAIPTLMNTSIKKLREISELFERYRGKKPDTIFPFLRVEGPFISKEKKGFQDENFVLEPTDKNVREFLSISHLKLFTFAPEIKGSDRLVDLALRAGKIPSIGHSNGKFKDVQRAYNSGVRHFTHFPNAIRGLHHREIGVAGAGLLLNDVHLEVIGDMIHCSKEFLKLLLKVRGPEFSLASDLIPSAFSELKEWNGKKLIRRGERIETEEGILAGGSSPVSRQAALLFEGGFSPRVIVKIACLNARKFFSGKEPSVNEGKEASFLVLNKKFEVTSIYYRGKKIK